MAAPSSIVALDIGSHTVKVGEFSASREGALTLQRFSSVALGLDPNKEEDRGGAVTQAVRQALGLAGIRGGRLYFSIAGHAAFMRSVKLPPVDALQLDQMVAFEAQQIVPFPLAEVVWDFMLLPSAPGEEKEAIIVAIKSDLLESEYSSVRAAGIEPTAVDVGPLALYNAYRYNYPKVDHCVLIVDIGARSTNLLFVDGDRLYTRILPLGGNTLSQTICNEFQEPFSVAEELKTHQAGVDLGGDFAPPEDPQAARLWKISRTVVGRIQAEINRSIIFYRNQQGGTSPQQILLTGGSSRLPHLDHFLAEKFNLPVEIFNPLQNVNVGGAVDRAGLALAGHSFGEVVGLALRGAGPAPAAVNLVPPSVAEKRRAAKQAPWVYAAFAAWFLLFAVLCFVTFRKTQIAEDTAQQLQGKVNQLATLDKSMDPVAKENDALNTQFKDAQRLISQRDAWTRLLADINSKVPQGVWIVQLTPTNNGNPVDSETKSAPAKGGKAPVAGKPTGGAEVNQLQIKGMFEDGLQPNVINRFVTGLAETSWFDLDPKKVANAIVSTDTPQPASGQLSWNYTLSLKLKEPISIAP